ncbi:hypothetical protein FF011L_43880 [Roseimaritima multifibrata]|uniref:Uncharacterized protein n=1 Tax=Roseimaritima multifibrata TaxID=1930274 RepID=A0A517ML70_9BACT|nr:hypothetical protein [Roseimaritima multifibrata]QDS95590.1 hypothetical protein FF011L_43880 [Roseimaritima multifibrata]
MSLAGSARIGEAARSNWGDAKSIRDRRRYLRQAVVPAAVIATDGTRRVADLALPLGNGHLVIVDELAACPRSGERSLRV